MNRLRNILTYLFNNRLKEYEYIIKYAINSGYIVTSVERYLNSEKNRKYLILRHDIDNVSLGTNLMHKIEKENEVYSSYYFRNSTLDPELMFKIIEYGSEVSYHFETLSDYAKSRNIKTNKELNEYDYINDCFKILTHDLLRFRKLYNVPCLTIASHGEPINKIIEAPNNVITEAPEICTKLGILLETYNKEFISNIDAYISDTTLKQNNGYRYLQSPIDAMNSKSRVILFLTHPNHWFFSHSQKILGAMRNIIFGSKIVRTEFKRI